MSTPWITADDRRWMKRRLATSLKLCLMMLLAGQLLRHDRVVAPADANGVTPSTSQPRDVPPEGWRRTNRGWERVDDWGLRYVDAYVPRRTLSDWIAREDADRDGWLGDVADRLRRIPPLAIAALQIIAIWLISRQASPRRVVAGGGPNDCRKPLTGT